MCIAIDIKIVIFVLFFYIMNVHEVYLLFLIFAIIHEIFHMIVGILLGFQPMKLSIMPLGASINFKIDIKSYNMKVLNGTVCSFKKFFVAIAGPLSNIIIAIVFYIKSDYILIVYINIILAMFNLLPIYPLDGGRGVKQILVILLGRRKALRYTNIVSNISLSIIAVIGVAFCYANRSVFLLFSLIYLIYIRRKENEIYRLKEKAYKILEKEIENC